MSAVSRIYLNAFDMACVGHQSAGLWRHPEDQGYRYRELGYWTNLARILEAGGFDALFLADVLGVYDVYGGSRDAAVLDAAQFPVNDPTAAVSAMAAVTETLGFGITLSLTYEQPYALARRLSTLDHLTDGRVAWNIVTSYLDSAARNLGLDAQIPHDQRYDIADEYLEVCYKLWEASWEPGAVVRDPVRGGIHRPGQGARHRTQGSLFLGAGTISVRAVAATYPGAVSGRGLAAGRQIRRRQRRGRFHLRSDPADCARSGPGTAGSRRRVGPRPALYQGVHHGDTGGRRDP